MDNQFREDIKGIISKLEVVRYEKTKEGHYTAIQRDPKRNGMLDDVVDEVEQRVDEYVADLMTGQTE